MEPEKRARLDQPEENGNNQNSVNLEKLVIDILAYLSTESNWSREVMMGELLSQALRHSEILKGNGVADLTGFRLVTDSQLQVLYNLFGESKKLTLNQITTPQNLPRFLMKFTKLEKLTIRVYEYDDFAHQGIRYTIKSLKVLNNSRVNWNFAIDRLADCCPSLTKLSLDGGALSAMMIERLRMLECVSLKNIGIMTPLRSYLINFIRMNKTLLRLKMVSTKTEWENIGFQNVIEEFLDAFAQENLNLRSLTFTLSNSPDQNINNLKNLRVLEKLTIYYSVHVESRKLLELISVLKNSLPHVPVTFREYCILPPAVMYFDHSRRTIFRARSGLYAHIIRKNHPNASIIRQAY